MSVAKKVLGAAGVLGGVVGAAALGGVTAQRVAIRRYRGAPDPDSVAGSALAAVGSGVRDVAGYGTLQADRSYSVVAADGAVLYVEEVGPLDAPMTVVFSHGWALRMGSWHHQRIELAGPWFGDPGRRVRSVPTPAGTVEHSSAAADPVTGGSARSSAAGSSARASGARTGPQIRMVFYDQRSHGRSGRGSDPHPPIGMLGGDLAAVLATAAPRGPVVLVGHSMGGMAVLALAGEAPEYFAERVAGVALVSTSATQSPSAEIGKIFLRRSNPVVKVVSGTAARYSAILERSRPVAKDAVWLLTRTLGFARKDVPAALVDFLDEMLSGTPIDVIADFAPGVLAHDQTAALPALAGIPAVVICGDSDRVTPPGQSRFLAAALPAAELVIIERSGHLPMLETPAETDDALRRLLWRSIGHAEQRRRAAIRPDSA